MPITDFEKYKSLTSDNKNLKADLKPLNFDALLKAGAFRVTHQGLDGDNYNPDPMAGFSLVSAYNDAVGGKGAGTSKWKDNPHALTVVKQLFSERPSDIGAHKYMQIVQSAKDLGLTDDDIYLLNNQKNSGVKMPEEYSSGGWTLI
jgi:hypothetical protein